MERQIAIKETVTELGRECPSGYSAALHFGFHSPDFLFQTYPTAWRDEYTENSLVMFDPALRWGMEHAGTIRWSEIPEAKDNVVMTRAAAHGVIYGFVCSVGESSDRSIFNGSRADREFTDAEIASIAEKVVKLHDLTTELDALSEQFEAELRALSIDVTHGGLA